MKVAKKTVVLDGDNAVGVRFKFGNGTVYKIMLADLDEATRDYAACHGIAQKGGDSFAGAKGDPDKAEEMFLPVFEGLMQNKWNRAREATGGELLVQALVDITGESAEGVRTMLAGKDEAERKAIRKHPQVDAKIKAIQAARAAEKATGTEELVL
jgi:hypothetical protein